MYHHRGVARNSPHMAAERPFRSTLDIAQWMCPFRDTGEQIVDVSVPQDTIEEHSKDQLSNTDARIEAEEKSISELLKRMTKETEIRQEQQSEVVTLIAKNAAATKLIKLPVKILNGFFASKLQSETSTEDNHEHCSDDESAKVCEKKADSETQRATHSSELEAIVSTSSVADEESAGLRRQLRTNAMCADAREIFATTKKDREQGIAGVLEARWTQSQDFDFDDNSIAENTQIGFSLHPDAQTSLWSCNDKSQQCRTENSGVASDCAHR